MYPLFRKINLKNYEKNWVIITGGTDGLYIYFYLFTFHNGN